MMDKKFDVINFHITENCNYRCEHCFAKFDNEKELNLDEWKLAVDEVWKYFVLNKIENGRINLAGGEPLVVKFLDDLIDYIASKNIKVSIITNASLFKTEKINNWENKVEMIGVSIDSLNHDTNIKIGRSNNDKTLNINKLVDDLKYIKSKGIKLKVNTVITKNNLNENLIELYEMVEFDRIKILCAIFNKNCNKGADKLEVSAKEFEIYCQKVQSLTNKKIIFEEKSDLEDSYVIIDPKGNLISNKNNEHKKINSILNCSLAELIEEANLDIDGFEKRYN